MVISTEAILWLGAICEKDNCYRRVKWPETPKGIQTFILELRAVQKALQRLCIIDTNFYDDSRRNWFIYTIVPSWKC